MPRPIAPVPITPTLLIDIFFPSRPGVGDQPASPSAAPISYRFDPATRKGRRCNGFLSSDKGRFSGCHQSELGAARAAVEARSNSGSYDPSCRTRHICLCSPPFIGRPVQPEPRSPERVSPHPVRITPSSVDISHVTFLPEWVHHHITAPANREKEARPCLFVTRAQHLAPAKQCGWGSPPSARSRRCWGVSRR